MLGLQVYSRHLTSIVGVHRRVFSFSSIGCFLCISAPLGVSVWLCVARCRSFCCGFWGCLRWAVHHFLGRESAISATSPRQPLAALCPLVLASAVPPAVVLRCCLRGSLPLSVVSAVSGYLLCYRDPRFYYCGWYGCRFLLRIPWTA